MVLLYCPILQTGYKNEIGREKHNFLFQLHYSMYSIQRIHLVSVFSFVRSFTNLPFYFTVCSVIYPLSFTMTHNPSHLLIYFI